MTWLQRVAQRVKLARGRCSYCDAILRDHNTTGFCDRDCDLAWQTDSAI